MRAEASFETLLNVTQMGRADAAAPDHGMPSMTLMENAGRAVADEIGRRFTPRPTAVLCGPGNNGGDGYIVARILKSRGWPVWCETIVGPATLKGDAAEAFRRWDGETRAAVDDHPATELFVDALFGVGLSRPLEGTAAGLAEALTNIPERVVAIDIPSGIHGDTGLALGGIAVRAGLTVTFVRRKPGHLLLPGRAHCGETVLADIGMPEAVVFRVMDLDFETFALAGGFAGPSNPTVHKYDRGHCLVVSGDKHSTGAPRLAALGAARAGAGLTTIAAPDEAAAIHASHLTSIMMRTDPLDELLADTRKNAIVIGPGLGLDAAAADKLNIVLAQHRPTVLDADALTLLAKDYREGIQKIHDLCVLTPHGGEFARLFPHVAADMPKIGKLEAARAAARRANAIVLLKGADTVIAGPDGRAAIDSLSPPWLATAGSGDVLAGLIGGLLAQGLEPFDAACAGVFLHGAAARHFGPGLTADDLPGAVPAVLAGLQSTR
ncbi:Bifunctional NAD(P)H-hydrate repair enzyme Nnr [Alphaproteobacteria bacterium SO-S41]|nr:Bifunctional NAD(P)H-hydrate repair enzyme Nnr [Alphaproteobacteria bacterium SO-S41]